MGRIKFSSGRTQLSWISAQAINCLSNGSRKMNFPRALVSLSLSLSLSVSISKSLMVVVLCTGIFLFGSVGDSYAWDLNGTPQVNHSTGFKMPNDLTQDSGEGVIPSSLENAGPTRVRIGLQITAYRKIVFEVGGGRRKTVYRKDIPIHRTLRARLNKKNNFFFDGYRIETSPISWRKSTKKYKTMVSIYKRYGAYGKIEEFLGRAKIAGVLTGKKGLFVLYGGATLNLRNKRGNPVADIDIGVKRTRLASRINGYTDPQHKIKSLNFSGPALEKSRPRAEVKNVDPTSKRMSAQGRSSVNIESKTRPPKPRSSIQNYWMDKADPHEKSPKGTVE